MHLISSFLLVMMRELTFISSSTCSSVIWFILVQWNMYSREHTLQIPFHVCLHGSKKWAKPILSLLLFHYKWISTRHAWEINSQCKLNLMLDNIAEEHNIMGTCVFIIYVSLSEVYDYSGHNILQCMRLVWSVHCTSSVVQSLFICWAESGCCWSAYRKHLFKASAPELYYLYIMYIQYWYLVTK